MPFVAADAETGERINALHYRQPKEELAGRRFICPFCQVEMLIRHGAVNRPHFAHRLHCPYADWAHAETPEHLATKETLAAWLHEDPFWREATIELEVRLPEAHRIADILVTFPDGTQVAHECQISRLSRKQFAARTRAYAQMEILVLWWFRTGYLKWVRHDLIQAIVDQQGTRLGISFQKRRRQADEQHPVYHTWPHRVDLWVYYPGMDITDDRLRLQGLELSWDDRQEVWRSVLWMPVRRVLASTADWCEFYDIHRQLHPSWQDRLRHRDLECLLSTYWSRGAVVAGPQETWRLPYLPGWRAHDWYHWLSKQPDGIVSDDELSEDYHYAYWRPRLERATTLEELRAVGEAIGRTERNPLVLDRLRTLYRECQERLRSSA